MTAPPHYSGQGSEGSAEIAVVPCGSRSEFQNGYLGADDERATIEGEVQVKGTSGDWNKLTLTLRSHESSFSHVVELARADVTLAADLPVWPAGASFPFAIPLMPDTPQPVSTPHSNIQHVLTAVLHPKDTAQLPLSKSLHVTTRRYSSHSHSLLLAPQTFTHNQPTRVHVQIPRTTFRAGESIPIYVTVPPPPTELVLDRAIRLRNVRAELVRVVQVNRDFDLRDDSHTEPDRSPVEPSSSTAANEMSSPLFVGSSYRTVIARSGGSCRFHASRPVRLRFVLHQPAHTSSPSNFQSNLPNGEYASSESSADPPPITQVTLLHAVTFHINVLVSFVDVSTRTERITTVPIPIEILPPPAPLPEMAPSIDADYMKKHDRPPARTVRLDDGEVSVPRYSEGQAGPSALPSGAPPPFEERGAPPPFSSAAEASSSTHPPTFLESQREIIVPHSQIQEDMQTMPPSPTIEGEGSEFGFPPELQFDGHSEDMQRSSTPPPTLEMATRDANLTSIADIREPVRAMEALGMVLDRHEENAIEGVPPPPPPAMDDPSDPPPSIDFPFAPGDAQTVPPSHPATPPPPHSDYTRNNTPPPPHRDASPPVDSHEQDHPPQHQNAPPPYLGVQESHQAEDHHNHHHQVARPPPYAD